MSLLRVTHGRNDLLYTEDGEEFVDLVSSTGAAFLGHANEHVNRHVIEQLGRISCSWTSATAIQDECKARVARHIEDELSLYSLYSSGMEAAEVALRMAHHETKRKRIVGFRNNHHGKSIATQSITGVDPDLPLVDASHRIPFVPERTEAQVLHDLGEVLASDDVAAVFIEPMQGRGGGHCASPDFYRDLQRMTRAAGTLIVCDEIFSGFYRTGRCFRYPDLDIAPDIVLVGKAVGNGFPVAGVLLREHLRFHPKDFRLSSTFSDNPLACAAVVGTLSAMEQIGVEARVDHIERALGALRVDPASEVRLKGAACFVELATEGAAAAVHDHLYRHRVLALRRGPVVGLWPPATITDDHLEQVVCTMNDALAEVA